MLTKLPHLLQNDWYSQLLLALTQRLSLDDNICACWVEGSVAQGLQDEQSDLDLWIAIENSRENEVFKLIEAVLEKHGQLDINYRMKEPNPELFHAVYHQRGAKEHQTLDINLRSKSRKIILIEGIDDYIVIFDKANIIKSTKAEIREINWVEVKTRVRQYYDLQHPNIVKNLNRNKPLEAKLYYDYLVEFIIKTIRLKYTPDKVDYGYKHIYRDLPSENLDLIKQIAFVKNANDILAGLKLIKTFVDDL